MRENACVEQLALCAELVRRPDVIDSHMLASFFSSFFFYHKVALEKTFRRTTKATRVQSLGSTNACVHSVCSENLQLEAEW